MATIEVNVCAGLDISGNTVHYKTPEPVVLQVADIQRVGTYVGPYHTLGLKDAQSTVFLNTPARHPNDILALHLAESPVVVHQRMISARNTSDDFNHATAATEAMLAIAKAQVSSDQAVRSGAAPAPRARTLATTGATGGF